MKLKVEQLLESLQARFADITDPRRGNNKQYRFEDLLMSAFSVFFMQSPSFLEHQRMFHTAHGKNACGSLFGIGRLPSDNHIRRQLDRIDCTEVFSGFDIALDQMKQHQALTPYQALGGQTLIALDGSEFHNSRKVHCPHCQQRQRNQGTEDQYTEYYHSVLAAVLVGAGHPYALPLRPQFITPQDGELKQDCETKAAYRWLADHAERYAELNPIYLGDDLYAKQPMCRKVLDAGANFIFRVKVNDHKTLFDYLDGIQWPSRRKILKTPGRSKPNKEYRYRWSHCTLPLTADKNALEAYYAELRIRNLGSTRSTTFRFITSLPPDRDNVAEIITCGRTRWKIENETFNLLKKQGYNLEHNFGHGQQGLSNTLLSLNLIAFSFHAVCDQLCALWQQARKQCHRRMRFFLTMDLVAQWQYFDSWRALLTPIADPSLRPIAKARPPP